MDLAYADRKERWRFDITLNIFGEGRIPNTMPNPEDYRFDVERSPAYATLHAQVTRVMGAWEVYLGGENLTSTLQQQQIIAADDPFGPYFDASLIWGPTNKAMIYGGLRFTIATEEPTNPEPMKKLLAISLIAALDHGNGAQDKKIENIEIRTSTVCDMCEKTIEENMIYEQGREVRGCGPCAPIPSTWNTTLVRPTPKPFALQ